jgi:hypothetical protein
LFVALFGLLLASFPARNTELWTHLTAGRTLVRGDIERVSPTWLYDVVSFALYQTVGGFGLVAVKAAVVGGLAVVLLRLSRTGRGWLIPVACTVLAVLSVANRALLAPPTVSYLLLAVAVGGTWRTAWTGTLWPGWRLVGLFALWGNTDRWFVLGLAVVALIRVGRWLDDRSRGGKGLLRELGAVAVLTAAAAANPAHLTGFPLPTELGWGTTAAGAVDLPARPGVTSPFGRSYLAALGVTPATLAYYPLVGLGLVSFLLPRSRWRWEWFLPWVGLAGLSALQARAVPFFAVVAGPVLAWNLQEFFARRPRPSVGPPVRFVAFALTAVLAAAFLAAAWPGWLQRPPFEPRRWAVQLPAGLEQAAAAVRRGYVERAWPEGSRTLHLARDTAAAFAWFCPEDDGVLDPQLAAAAAGGDNAGAGADERLAAAGIGRVVIHAADQGVPLAALTRLLADPDRWPLLHLQGGVVVFGHRGPTRAGHPDPYHGRELDLDRLAFRPDEGEKAPPTPAALRRWWDVFWRPALSPTGDREQAAVLLLKAEVLRGSAPVRHLAEWEMVQEVALAAASAGWTGPGAATDAAVRLTVLHPPVPEGGRELPPITWFTFACQQPFVLARDDAPPGLLYAAVRAARRGVSADPDDATGYLLLGRCYLWLLTDTRERFWALRFPQLAPLRQAQASAALNRAITLNPGLAQAHLELGGLYRQVGYLDLALTHLKAYRDITRRAGDAEGRRTVTDADLADLAGAVDRQLAAFAPESSRARAVDRARAALTRGLAGEARTILLGLDVAAFGAEGAELELDLLLRTGRAHDVRDWTAAEIKESLGPVRFHWLRTQALAALGEYAAADAELIELAGEEGPTRAANLFALVTGRAVLDEQPAGVGLPALVWRALARSEFRSAVQQVTARLAARADADVFRGLLALEAGEVDRAREVFRAALANSANSLAGGGLDFNGRPVAHGALDLLR